MRPELERVQLIENQLYNNSSALPAEDWNLRLLIDGELATDTATQQQLYHGLRLAGQAQLRQEIRQIHTQLYGGWRAWLRRLRPM